MKTAGMDVGHLLATAPCKAAPSPCDCSMLSLHSVRPRVLP